MSLRLYAAFILIVLSLLPAQGISLAQDGGDTLPEGVIFRPAEEIIQGEFIVTNFASDGTATLPIETTAEVACSIVYGKTPAFGMIALDQDMGSGAHSQHNPLLTGLEPETTYYFRVQGVDANGVIYLSDVMTFTTPAFETGETANLASPQRGATIIGYSSAFGGAGLDDRWGAGSAFDDNPNTQWSSAGDGDNAWVEVQLEKPARIHSVAFWSRSMADGTAITLAFTVTTDSGEVFGPFELLDAESIYQFEVDIQAQTLRFDLMNTTGGNTGAVDIAVYGEFIE
jgi:hypothetical protein